MRGIRAGTLHQPGIAFHADHFAIARCARQRQGEVAQAAEQIQHALARLHVQQLQRAGDHRLVELGVDLDEVQRAEHQFDVPLRQPERQLRRIAGERVNGIDATRLQEDRKAFGFSEGRELRLVGIGEWLQVAEHKRDLCIAGDELDLRDVAARVQAIDQCAQRRDLEAQLRDHDMAFADVGHEARILLAEPDQGLVLLLDPAHREATLPAIAPAVPAQWWQHALRRNMADALQVLQQDPLLGLDLPLVNVHNFHGQTATAIQAEIDDGNGLGGLVEASHGISQW